MTAEKYGDNVLLIFEYPVEEIPFVVLVVAALQQLPRQLAVAAKAVAAY